MRIAIILMMAGLLGCSNQNTQAVGPTSADLKQTVQSRLASNPQLTQIDVSADADRNQVTLSGTVPTEQLRSEAVEMTKAARANLTIVDKIDVKPEVASRGEYNEDTAREAREKAKALGDKIGQSLDDAWVYSKIEAKLAGRSGAKAFTETLKINVDVVGNVVTLRGVVDTPEAKQEAERIAKATDGVKEVRNLLRVKS